MQHGAEVDGGRVSGSEQVQHELGGMLVVADLVGRLDVIAADRCAVVVREIATAAGPQADRSTSCCGRAQRPARYRGWMSSITCSSESRI